MTNLSFFKPGFGDGIADKKVEKIGSQDPLLPFLYFWLYSPAHITWWAVKKIPGSSREDVTPKDV